MCLLILKPAGLSIPEEYLTNAAISNPHGSGVAIARGDNIVIQKDPSWRAKEIKEILDENIDHTAIVHFRFATHGSKTVENTHPFVLNDDWVAAHNGVITIPTYPDESDTRAFLRKHVVPILDNGYNLTDKEILEILSTEMGSYNKMTFLHKDGSYGIANEDAGHWKDGVWYSNHNYIKSKYNYADWEDDYDYHGSWGHNTSYFDKRTAAQPPVAPYVSSFGRVIQDDDHPEDDCCDNSHALMVLPDKTNEYNEKWHVMDTTNLVCNCCNSDISGRFVFESTNDLLVCEDCCRFLPSSLHLPRSIRGISHPV